MGVSGDIRGAPRQFVVTNIPSAAQAATPTPCQSGLAKTHCQLLAYDALPRAAMRAHFHQNAKKRRMLPTLPRNRKTPICMPNQLAVAIVRWARSRRLHHSNASYNVIFKASSGEQSAAQIEAFPILWACKNPRKTILALLIVAFSSGAALAGCGKTDPNIDFNSKKPVTLHGTVVISATVQNVEGVPAGAKYTALALDPPICASGGGPGTDFGDLQVTLLMVNNVSMQYLGHQVALTGVVTEGELDWQLAVQSIKDISTAVAEPSPKAEFQGGEHASDEGCLFIGRVYGLDPHGANNLSVRNRPYGPSGPTLEKDQLFTDEKVCVRSIAGKWLNVSYERNGRAFSGWVHSRYIQEEGEAE
jgi:hypothetical protein